MTREISCFTKVDFLHEHVQKSFACVFDGREQTFDFCLPAPVLVYDSSLRKVVKFIKNFVLLDDFTGFV